MANLVEIQTQIEKLQKQASDIRAREFDRTVGEILKQMQAFGITLRDLQLAQGKVRSRKGKGRAAGKKVAGKTAAVKRSPAAGKKIAAKYRGPKGETWSGRGSMPKWLSALVAKGRTKDEFAIRPR